MKKYYSLAALVLAATALIGCSDDRDFSVSTEGNLILSATYNSDVTIASRATLEEELSDSTLIWISSEKGLVRKFDGLDELPADGIKLVSGDYIAEAWAGDSVSASFDKRYFKGRQPFTISKGTTQVEMVCKIANSVVTVTYDDALDGVLSDYTMTVGHTRGQLEFVGKDERKGYFMMPTGVTELTYTLKGTQVDGSEFTTTGTITDVKPTTQYDLKVVYNPETESIGGGYLVIEIDESELEVEDSITIMAAPTITGYGYDISNPVYGEPGKIGKKSVYVTASSALTSFVIESENLVSIIGGNDVDLFLAGTSVIETLEATGITYQYVYNEEADISNLKLSFQAAYTNTLTGDNEFKFTAVDSNSKSGKATLVISVTDASVDATVLSADSPDIYATKVTLSGKILKDDVVNPGFEYRQGDSSEWSFVAGAMSRATGEYFALVEGLNPGTKYVYRAVCDGFTSANENYFTTENAVQLPNASFENWITEGKVVIPGSSLTEFWDSGNHGSSTMSVNITDKSSDYVHTGSYSAKLRSQFVGVFGIGKFAAGNIFAGNYLYTDGTDGELGWGRVFTSRPEEMKFWVKYEPGTVNDKGSGDYMAEGATDQGIVYIALMDDNLVSYSQSKSDFNGTSWPVVVKTKSSNRSLFDPNGEHVIAYAEVVFDKATEGSGLVEVTAKLNYLRTDVKPSYVVFVASASRYGDYFQGGEGSTLYLDDVELVY